MTTYELRVSQTEFSEMIHAMHEHRRYRMPSEAEDAMIEAALSTLDGKVHWPEQHPLSFTEYKIVVVSPASILDEIPRIKGTRKTHEKGRNRYQDY